VTVGDKLCAIAKDACPDFCCLQQACQLIQQRALAGTRFRQNNKKRALLKELLFSEGLFADNEGSRDVDGRRSSAHAITANPLAQADTNHRVGAYRLPSSRYNLPQAHCGADKEL
jgi:hypothetical protein